MLTDDGRILPTYVQYGTYNNDHLAFDAAVLQYLPLHFCEENPGCQTKKGDRIGVKPNQVTLLRHGHGNIPDKDV